jgi:hypothetical protein
MKRMTDDRLKGRANPASGRLASCDCSDRQNTERHSLHTMKGETHE